MFLEKIMKKNIYNKVGATYLAVNNNGWSCDSSPLVALSDLDLGNYDGTTPRYKSKNWEERARKTSLWYIPSYEDWVGTTNFVPVDKDGNCCGLQLHSSYEGNDKNIHKRLKDAVFRFKVQDA